MNIDIMEKNDDNNSLENIIGDILIKNKLTVSTAESCTGGMLSARLINYPGISEAFMEGAVTYSNEAKMKRLGVREDTLKKYGAVSSQTAEEMAEGIAKASGTDIGISTTGIAGPGGGTDEKPVGLVFIGLYIKGNVKSLECHFKGGRQIIREKTVVKALEMLINELSTK